MSFLVFLIRKSRSFYKWFRRRVKKDSQKIDMESLPRTILPGAIVVIAFALFLYLNYIVLPEKYQTIYSRTDVIEATPSR